MNSYMHKPTHRRTQNVAVLLAVDLHGPKYTPYSVDRRTRVWPAH